MSRRTKVLKSLEKKNRDELRGIGELYAPLLKTARGCLAENVIYRKAQDSIDRDTSTHPRISHGLVAGVFSEMKQQPEKADSYAKLLGKFLLPLCSLEPQKNSIACEIGTTQQIFCPDSEEYFVNALTQIDSNTYFGQPRLSVYHDKDGEPVALRKSTQESSALLLRDASMGRLLIPRGTFVGICKDSQATLTGQKAVSDGNDAWELESYGIENGFTIAPGRLSPWAHKSPSDRAIFGITRYSNVTIFDSDRSKQCVKHDLKSFKKVSKKILQQIGIFN